MKHDLHCEASEFEYRARTTVWYGVVTGMAAILAGLGVVMKNYLFAAIIAGGYILTLVSDREAPRVVELRIGDEGIVWGERKILYVEIESFAVVQESPRSGCLAIYMKASPSDPVRIPIEGRLPEVRSRMNEHLDEVVYEESITNMIGRFLGVV